MLNVKGTQKERAELEVSESLEGVTENIVRIRVHPVGAARPTVSHRSELKVIKVISESLMLVEMNTLRP